MAKKQSRRSVSLNRHIYEAAKEAAEQRGLTLAAFVEASLAANGVPVVVHAQQPLARVLRHPGRRAAHGIVKAPSPVPSSPPSHERLAFGDAVADAMGFS